MMDELNKDLYALSMLACLGILISMMEYMHIHGCLVVRLESYLLILFFSDWAQFPRASTWARLTDRPSPRYCQLAPHAVVQCASIAEHVCCNSLVSSARTKLVVPLIGWRNKVIREKVGSATSRLLDPGSKMRKKTPRMGYDVRWLRKKICGKLSCMFPDVFLLPFSPFLFSFSGPLPRLCPDPSHGWILRKELWILLACEDLPGSYPPQDVVWRLLDKTWRFAWTNS